MSITPTPLAGHDSSSRSAAPPPSTSGGSSSNLPSIILAIVMVLGLGGLFWYSSTVNDKLEQVRQANTTMAATIASQGDTLQRLSRRLEQSDVRANEIKGTLDEAQTRLGSTQAELQKAHKLATDLAKQQTEVVENTQHLGSQLTQLQQEQATTKGAVGTLSTDITGVKGDVQSTKQELASTRAQLQKELQSVVGDLGVQSGLIARNRGEIDELRALGDRDYVEFDLKKNSKRQKVGSVQLELKSADAKKLKYTVALVVDDKTIEKKDKTAAEPVQFFQQGFRAPSEMVVNQIYKDRIVGYISTPKKKEDRAPMKTS